MDSILTSIKKLLGITEEYDCFDDDIVIHINTAFSVLNQIGIGPEDGFMIHDSSTIWDEFEIDKTILNLVKNYIHLKVKSIFDPPQSSSVLNAITSQLNELEWRLSVLAPLEGEEENQNE